MRVARDRWVGAAPEVAVKNEPAPALQVEDRTNPAPVGAYAKFKTKGFPGEQATISWDGVER